MVPWPGRRPWERRLSSQLTLPVPRIIPLPVPRLLPPALLALLTLLAAVALLAIGI